MKKIIYSGIFLFFTNSYSTAQVTGSITVENFNPNFIEAHIPFLGFDFSPSNSTIFADFGGKFKKSNFFVDVQYSIAYVNGLEEFYYAEGPLNTANSIYEYKSPKKLNMILGYMIIKKEVDTKVNFHLNTSGFGKSAVDHYVKVPSKQTRFVMADLGIRKGFNQVYCAGKDLIIEKVVEPDGFRPPAAAAIRTMMDYTMLQVGVSAGNMGYWEANIDGYGLRRTERFIRYYADILFLLNSAIDPIYNDERTTNTTLKDKVYTQYNLNNSKRSKLGFCIGASINNISKFGIQEGVEIGYIPGIKGSFKSNLTFSITSSFSLGKILK